MAGKTPAPTGATKPKRTRKAKGASAPAASVDAGTSAIEARVVTPTEVLPPEHDGVEAPAHETPEPTDAEIIAAELGRRGSPPLPGPFARSRPGPLARAGPRRPSDVYERGLQAPRSEPRGRAPPGAQVPGYGRCARRLPPGRLQPPAGGEDRLRISAERLQCPRPDPGGQRGADARGPEVRPNPRREAELLRRVVDSAPTSSGT